MTPRIMPLDMFELRRRRSERAFISTSPTPIKPPQPIMQSRIPRANISNITFEVLDVDCVEADQGCEEADVGFCDVRAEVVWCCGAGVCGEQV